MKRTPRNYLHTPEQIANELKVDEQGQLWWLKPGRGRILNKPIGCFNKDRYLHTNINKEEYTNHTLAWCLYYGRWPAPNMVLDHVNHKKWDNRKENLREVTVAENARNRKELQITNNSGVTGVRWDLRLNKWKVYLDFMGKSAHGGYYIRFEDAVAARLQLEIEYGAAEYSLLAKPAEHNEYLKGIEL